MQYTLCTKKVDAYHSIMDQKSMPLLQLNSSSAECFEFVRTSFFTHKSFDHYSLTQKQQSAFSIPTSCLMVSLYLFPGSYIENPILFNKKIPKCPSISFMQRNMNSDRNRKMGQAKYHTSRHYNSLFIINRGFN